jgi:hypothetical protein
MKTSKFGQAKIGKLPVGEKGIHSPPRPLEYLSGNREAQGEGDEKLVLIFPIPLLDPDRV